LFRSKKEKFFHFGFIMSQFNYIKDIAKFGLENDQERLLSVLNELIEYSKKTKKLNFALQLQSILKDAIRHQQTSGLFKIGSEIHSQKIEDREFNDFIIEKLTSDYSFNNLICEAEIKEELSYLIKEHRASELLHQFDLPIANKILLHGPSGCGKTLASYVIAGELEKMMIVINLGAIVSSKLGETSKNLSKIFKRAASEDLIIFFDEFDSLGKVRDYSQDHGEMKRIVNTILQLFDYLPQGCIVIAATNQVSMIDEALLRRFDLNIQFNLPTESRIKELVGLTLKNGKFQFDKPKAIDRIVKESLGLSYYTIQKTLITSLKRSLFDLPKTNLPATAKINTQIWLDLILKEKKHLLVK
jgi:AAA+ superfamily predicted ATPase